MSKPQPYEYRFEDHSVLLRLTERPLLQRIVRALPRGLTPNQITLSGHASAVSAFVILISVRPINAFALVAIALTVLYFTLADCLDGLFARHSGQTSRLGEMLDHWLDAFTVPLVVFTLCLAMPAPAWLVFSSAVVTAFLHHMTLLHGYRTGIVQLGAIGIIEGTVAGAGACVLTAIAGPSFLGAPRVAGLSIAALLIIAMLVGGATSLYSMRKLRHWPGDILPVVGLLACVGLWYRYGQLSPIVGGVLAIAISSYFEGSVVRARLLRAPLITNDVSLGILVAGGAATSIALELNSTVQALLAAAAVTYALTRSAISFARSVRELQQPITPVSAANAEVSAEAHH